MSAQSAVSRAIGGFLPLESGSGGSAAGVLAFWGATNDNAWWFVNARSALAHLLRSSGVKRLLLPAYICPELVQSARGCVEVAFYSLTDDLSPEVAPLAAEMCAGDCVVAVDYFGNQPNDEFRTMVAARPDILWVEDRAQALMPAAHPWAEWVLYSPRKLFGVPDGGVLVRARGGVEPVAHVEKQAVDRVRPRTWRRDDVEERDNLLWYAAYRDVEDAMTVSDEAMSDLSRQLLDHIDPGSVVRRRQWNYSILADLLADVALFSGAADDFAPLGFPVRILERDAVWRALADRRVFAARYWPELSSDPETFPVEHALSRDVLVLPCDQRYDGDDMQAVARIFREIHP